MNKYQKTEGYWVYSHTTPDGKQYIGMSKLQPRKRWFPSLYKGTALQQYIERYGWENIIHTVLLDNLSKEQAEQWEDRLITVLRMNELCINERRSGGIARDNKKDYNKVYHEANREEQLVQMKAYREANREEIREKQKAYDKQRRSTPEGKIYSRVNVYNQRHPNLAIETPLEAKQKYLDWGYIPSYVKNVDLY